MKDPVCGMTVDPDKAARKSDYQGKAYSFCSVGCKAKFDTAPEQYLKVPSLLVSVLRKDMPSAIDPVCGMKVDPSQAAVTVERQGAAFYFCSQGCATKFRAEPERYLRSKPADIPAYLPTKNRQPAEYTCPMDPEVRQMGPGSCPKCGMALEPAVIKASTTRTEYTCPMHPQIIRSEPGSCPICGMALEPRELGAEETNPELVDMTRRFWISVALAVPMSGVDVLRLSPLHAASAPALSTRVGLD
jgi:Cu+-exporting ATPase